MTTNEPVAGAELVELPAFGTKTLLMGGVGSGKTHCIRTLIDAGITPFVIFTEPGMRTLADVPKDKLHWTYLPPANVGFDTMYESAKKINSMSFKSLASLEAIDKKDYQQFLQLLSTLRNFTCDRTGEEFGDVSTWDTDRALIIDSQSGLNTMAMDLVVGSKPTKAMSDWGVAMDNLERLINMLTTGVKCHFILTAHQEREQDEVTGAVRVMASILGRKLAPRLPRNFDDVVQCALGKDGQYVWQTESGQADLKYRNLERSSALKPSFVPLIESWRKAYS